MAGRGQVKLVTPGAEQSGKNVLEERKPFDCKGRALGTATRLAFPRERFEFSSLLSYRALFPSLIPWATRRKVIVTTTTPASIKVCRPPPTPILCNHGHALGCKLLFCPFHRREN